MTLPGATGAAADGAADDAGVHAAAIDAELRALGTPERAVTERAYLKSAAVHHGTSVPDMRRVVRRFLRAHPDIDHDTLFRLTTELWSTSPVVHERRMAAVDLLVARSAVIDGDDLDWIEQRIREAGTWALVDTLAHQIVAAIVVDDRSALSTIDRWVTDDDFWVRRSAVLALGRLLRDGDELPRFVAYADALLDEREFFIRKALGWIARDTGRHHPAPISVWLRANEARMNGVTIREAVKHLPDGDEILQSWKERDARSSGQVPGGSSGQVSRRRNSVG